MRRCFWTAAFLTLTILALLVAGCRKERTEVALESKAEKLSYAIGLNIGRDIDKQELDLDPELVVRGFQDGFSGNAPALSDEEIEQVRKDFRDRRKAALEEEAAKNLEEGRAFLAENARKEGW